VLKIATVLMAKMADLGLKTYQKTNDGFLKKPSFKNAFEL
jgi:hypothetical protein